MRAGYAFILIFAKLHAVTRDLEVLPTWLTFTLIATNCIQARYTSSEILAGVISTRTFVKIVAIRNCTYKPCGTLAQEAPQGVDARIETLTSVCTPVTLVCVNTGPIFCFKACLTRGHRCCRWLFIFDLSSQHSSNAGEQDDKLH